MSEPNLLERVLLNDRAFVVTALGVVIVVSWLYLLAGAGTGMSTWAMTSWRMALGLSTAMAMPVEWTPAYAVMMFFMWWIMMIAMMLPSAAPMVLVYSKIHARSAGRDGAPAARLPPALAFTAGYLAVWALFSVVAAGLQWLFESIGVLSPMMMNSTSELFAGAILLFAGLYQLTPLKQACLEHCRGPLGFLIHNWRPGLDGAFAMGAHHGAYCLGCCWALMAVLFFGGIMNLYWIIALAVLVLVEKVLPAGPAVSYITGALLTLWGSTFVLRAFM